ncbi:MAG TPA: PIN domain-containing protein [Candidatus Sulfotelmatobacter sp.]
MIGLDTNVLARYVTHGHPAQAAAAAKVIDSLSSESPGFLSWVVIAELEWVLQFSFHFKKHEIEHIVERLLRSRELVVERAEIVSPALRKFHVSRANFADCLMERCGHAAECQYVLTVD